MNYLRKRWVKFLVGDISANGVAAGFALGTFVALLPTFGFGIFFVLWIVILFPKINKPAAILAMAFWNPIFQAPVYSVSFLLGNELFGGLSIVVYKIEILSQIYNFTRRFLVAHIIVSLVVSALAYIIGYHVGKRVEKQNKKLI